jgi:hypothetical protein
MKNVPRKLLLLAQAAANEVAEATGVSVVEIVSTSRIQHVVIARMMVMALLRRCGLTLETVGLLTCRDHGTVIHAVKRIESIETDDRGFERLMVSLLISLKSTHPNLLPRHWSTQVDAITHSIERLRRHPEALAKITQFTKDLAAQAS